MVRSEIGPTLEDGMAIYHLIGQYEFPQKGFPKRKPLTRDIAMMYYCSQRDTQIPHPFTPLRGLHPRFHRGTSRNATYPYGRKPSFSLLRQKVMPQNRASLCTLSLNFTSLPTFIRILLFPCFQFLPSFFAGV